MNQSEIIVMLDSGAGVRIRESFGMLDVVVNLPPTFNSTCGVSSLLFHSYKQPQNRYTAAMLQLAYSKEEDVTQHLAYLESTQAIDVMI